MVVFRLFIIFGLTIISSAFLLGITRYAISMMIGKDDEVEEEEDEEKDEGEN